MGDNFHSSRMFVWALAYLRFTRLWYRVVKILETFSALSSVLPLGPLPYPLTLYFLFSPLAIRSMIRWTAFSDGDFKSLLFFDDFFFCLSRVMRLSFFDKLVTCAVVKCAFSLEAAVPWCHNLYSAFPPHRARLCVVRF